MKSHKTDPMGVLIKSFDKKAVSQQRVASDGSGALQLKLLTRSVECVTLSSRFSSRCEVVYQEGHIETPAFVRTCVKQAYI